MKSTDGDGAHAELSRGPEAIGALSRIGEHSVQAALAIARRGHVFDLGLEFNSRIPHNPEFVRFAMAFTIRPKRRGKRRHSSTLWNRFSALCTSERTSIP